MAKDEVVGFLARLEAVMKRQGVNRSELARRLGARASTVSEWWTVGRAPNGELLLRLPEVLGVGPGEIFYDENATGALRADHKRGGPMYSAPIELLSTLSEPEGVRRMAGRPRIQSLFQHAYAIGVAEGFSDEELRVLEAWRDAELAKLEK